MTIFRRPWRITPEKLGIVQKEKTQDKRDRKGLSVELQKHLKTLNFQPPEPEVPSIFDRQREAISQTIEAKQLIDDPARTRFNLQLPRLAQPIKTGLLDKDQRRQLIPFAKVTNELQVALSREDLALDDFLALDAGRQAQLLFPNIHPTARLALLTARMKEAIDEKLGPPTGGPRLRAGASKVAGKVAGLLGEGAKQAFNAPFIPIPEGPEGTKIKGLQTGILPTGVSFKSVAEVLEKERKESQKITRPVLGKVGQGVGEAIFDPSGRRFAVPFTDLGKVDRSPESAATRERLAAGTAELFRDVGGELAVLSNIIPIPFLDPLIVRILSKTVGKIPAVFRAGKAFLTPEGRSALRQGLANIMSDPSVSAADKVLANQSMRELVAAKPIAGGATGLLPEFHPKFTAPEGLDFVVKKQKHGASAIAKVDGIELHLSSTSNPNDPEVGLDEIQIILERVSGKASIKEIKVLRDVIEELVSLNPELEFFATTGDAKLTNFYSRIGLNQSGIRFGEPMFTMPKDIRPIGTKDAPFGPSTQDYSQFAKGTYREVIRHWIPPSELTDVLLEQLDGEMSIFIQELKNLDPSEYGSLREALGNVTGEFPELRKLWKNALEIEKEGLVEDLTPFLKIDAFDPSGSLMRTFRLETSEFTTEEVDLLRKSFIAGEIDLEEDLLRAAKSPQERSERRNALANRVRGLGQESLARDIERGGSRDVADYAGEVFDVFWREGKHPDNMTMEDLAESLIEIGTDQASRDFIDARVLPSNIIPDADIPFRGGRDIDQLEGVLTPKNLRALRNILDGYDKGPRLSISKDELSQLVLKMQRNVDAIEAAKEINVHDMSAFELEQIGKTLEEAGGPALPKEPLPDISTGAAIPVDDSRIGLIKQDNVNELMRLSSGSGVNKEVQDMVRGFAHRVQNAIKNLREGKPHGLSEEDLTELEFTFGSKEPSIGVDALSTARKQAEDIGEEAAAGLGAERFITQDNIDELLGLSTFPQEDLQASSRTFAIKLQKALDNLKEGKPHGMSQEELVELEKFFGPDESFTSIDFIGDEPDPGFPPFMSGGSQARPTVKGGEPPSLDLWRKLSWSMLHAPNAQDMLRRVSKKLSEIPLIKNILNTTGGPAAIADLDPVLDASVIYEVMKDLLEGERSQALALLRSARGLFKAEAKQTGRVKIGNRWIAMGDLAESVLKGETKYKLLDEQVQWIRDAKAFIDIKAAQVEVVTGEKLVLDEFYWPRFTRDDKNVVRVGGRPGSKPSPLKDRIFEVQEESIQLGNRYADPQSTVELYGEALDRVIVDRLFRDVLDETQILRTIVPEELVDPKIHSAMAVATERLRIAKQRALRERNVVIGSRTEAVRSIDVLRGRQSVARERLSGIKGELKPRRKQVPLSTGKRLHAAIEESTRAAEELQAFRVVGQDIPKPTFPAQGVSPKVRIELSRAQAGFNKAKNARTNAMKRARRRAASGKRDETSGAVLGPSFGGRVISKDDLAKIQTIIKPGLSGLRPFEMAAAIPRLLVTGLMDVGQMMIQMVIQLTSDPVRWSAGVGRGFQAMLKPRQFLRWIGNSPDAADAASHLVDMGGSEFTEAIRRGPLSKLGKATDVLGIIPRGFDGMLTASRVYEYKALADTARAAGNPESELFRIGRYVNTKMGTTGIRGLGISATQRQVENAFGFYSARYTRSLFGMVGYLFGKGIAAKDARVSLAKLAFGATITVYALARALGMSHKEALERINPRSGSKFMSLPIGGNEFGFGSGYRSFVKFIGDLTVQQNWEFDSWGDAAKNNPFVRYLRSRTTPLTGSLMDFITGEDFIGQEVNIDAFIDNPINFFDYLSEKTLPLNLRAYIEARGSLGSKIASGLVETIGGRTFKRSRSSILAEAREKALNELYPDFKGSFKDLKQENRIRAAKVDEDPRVVEALKAFEEQGRFKESQESKFFGAADEALQEAFTAQENDDQRYIDFFVKGEGLGMDPEIWKRNFRERQVRLTAKREGLQEAYGVEFGDTTDDQGKVNRAIENYYGVSFDTFVDPVTGEINWDGFFSARDRALIGLSASDRRSVEEFLHRNDTPLISEFRKIRGEVAAYYEIDSEDRRARELWRIRNPRGDAILWILGNVSRVMSTRSLREAETLSLQVFGTTVKPPLGGGGSVNPVFAGPSFQPFRPRIGVR